MYRFLHAYRAQLLRMPQLRHGKCPCLSVHALADIMTHLCWCCRLLADRTEPVTHNSALQAPIDRRSTCTFYRPIAAHFSQITSQVAERRRQRALKALGKDSPALATLAITRNIPHHADKKLAQMADLPDIPLADLEDGLGMAEDSTPTAPARTTASNEQVAANGFQDVSSLLAEQPGAPTTHDEGKASSFALSPWSLSRVCWRVYPWHDLDVCPGRT